MIEAWLLCKIDKGMFPGELGINFGDVGGRDVSLYSSEKFVDKEKSSLLVTVLNKGDKSAWVRLPGQSFNGTSVVEVPIANLKDVLQVA